MITQAVFGIGEKSEKRLGKGVYKSYGRGREGFNVTSCQFALHYFFENIIVLTNFIQNVSDATKIGGHFIGTCYDGKSIFDDLKKYTLGQGMTLFKNDMKIWELLKLYENEDFKDEESSLGYTIDVYQETIGKNFKEYLVNFTYFKTIMENYGFILVSKTEANDMNLPNGSGMFNELFTHMESQILVDPELKKSFGDSHKMSHEEKKISFYNRYFVFKKERNVGTIKLNKDTPSKFIVKPTNIRKLSKRIIIK